MITLQKRPPEIRNYTFDFSLFPEMVNGDTINSVLAVVGTIIQGTGGIPTQSAPGFTNTTVFLTLTGGSANIIVQYSCKVTTAGGATLEMLGNLRLLTT